MENYVSATCTNCRFSAVTITVQNLTKGAHRDDWGLGRQWLHASLRIGTSMLKHCLYRTPETCDVLYCLCLLAASFFLNAKSAMIANRGTRTPLARLRTRLRWIMNSVKRRFSTNKSLYFETIEVGT